MYRYVCTHQTCTQHWWLDLLHVARVNVHCNPLILSFFIQMPGNIFSWRSEIQTQGMHKLIPCVRLNNALLTKNKTQAFLRFWPSQDATCKKTKNDILRCRVFSFSFVWDVTGRSVIPFLLFLVFLFAYTFCIFVCFMLVFLHVCILLIFVSF